MILPWIEWIEFRKEKQKEKCALWKKFNLIWIQRQKNWYYLTEKQQHTTGEKKLIVLQHCECTKKTQQNIRKRVQKEFWSNSTILANRFAGKKNKPKEIKMSEHDFKLNIDSLIERLLEGKLRECANYLKIKFESNELYLVLTSEKSSSEQRYLRCQRNSNNN